MSHVKNNNNSNNTNANSLKLGIINENSGNKPYINNNNFKLEEVKDKNLSKIIERNGESVENTVLEGVQTNNYNIDNNKNNKNTKFVKLQEVHSVGERHSRHSFGQDKQEFSITTLLFE